MLEESGQVIAVEQGMVWVGTIARSSCSHCSSDNCSTSVIARLFGMKRNRLLLNNHLQARPGDRVVIGIPDTVLVKASLWAYLLPILSLLLTAVVSSMADLAYGYQALAALSGLALGLYGVRRATGSESRRGQFEPVMLRLEGLTSRHVELNF